jgi:hypothetical protein
MTDQEKREEARHHRFEVQTGSYVETGSTVQLTHTAVVTATRTDWRRLSFYVRHSGQLDMLIFYPQRMGQSRSVRCCVLFDRHRFRDFLDAPSQKNVHTVRYRLFHDHLVLGVDGDLDVVADADLRMRRHGAAVGIGERRLAFAALFQRGKCAAYSPRFFFSASIFSARFLTREPPVVRSSASPASSRFR